MTKPKPVRSVPVADDPSHRVLPEFKGKLATTPANGASTLHEMAAKSFETYGGDICMRKRQFLGWKKPGKVKEFAPDELIELAYSDVQDQAYKFGAALRAHGCVPSAKTTDLNKVKTPCRMAIFENTCPEWMIAALGAFSQSIGVTTVYATLGIESVMEAIVDNSIPVIVCNKTNVKYVVEKSRSMPCLKCVVYTEDLVAPNMTVEIPAAPRGLNIYSFADFIASGDTDKYPLTPPTPDTTAVIMVRMEIPPTTWSLIWQSSIVLCKRLTLSLSLISLAVYLWKYRKA